MSWNKRRLAAEPVVGGLPPLVSPRAPAICCRPPLVGHQLPTAIGRQLLLACQLRSVDRTPPPRPDKGLSKHVTPCFRTFGSFLDPSFCVALYCHFLRGRVRLCLQHVFRGACRTVTHACANMATPCFRIFAPQNQNLARIKTRVGGFNALCAQRSGLYCTT